MSDRTKFYYKYLQTALLQRAKKLARMLLSGRNDYRRFVILSAPRTGSTLLHTYLNSSLHICSLGEQPWRDLESGINQEYFKSYPKLIQAVGFKVFYLFANKTPYQQLYSELVNVPDIHVIHLTRENVLEQYVSEQLAWQRKEWTVPGIPSKPSQIMLDIEKFEVHIDRQQKLRNQCLEDFKNHKMIEVSYEMLVSNPQVVLDELQDFLGVSNRKLFTVLKKQRIIKLDEVLENAEEVRSKYPQFFDR